MDLSKNRRIVFALAAGALLALATTILAFQPGRAAGPWYVSPDGDDANDCLSPATPCATINGAIGKASAGDTIYVAVGTYTGTGEEVVSLDKDATLSGGWDVAFTAQAGTSTLDGEGARRGMTVDGDAFVFVERLTVLNGVAEAGGGIYIDDGSLTLEHSTIMDNTADRGGGIWTYGSLILSHCTVSGNREANWASYGAGIGTSGGNITLISSTVSGNVGEGINNGGGAHLHLDNSSVSDNEDLGIFIEWHYAGPGTLTMIQSTVGSNRGMGIRSVNGNLNLNESTISHNRGGGINFKGGTAQLTNCTVSANASASGGGILIDGGTVSLLHSTISGNTAFGAGGGINALGGAVVIQNSILAGNTAGSSPDCTGVVTSADHNLIGDPSGCTFTPSPGDLTSVDPALGMLVGSPGYHPLLPSSPAIDAIPLGQCTLASDQRGVARPQGPDCDIGSYEYTMPGPAASITAVGGTPQRTPPLLPFADSLQVAVLDSLGTPVGNALVTFDAPAAGASGTFAESGTHSTMVSTDEGGIATAATLVANEHEGSYVVTGTASGLVDPAQFLLSNFGWYVSPGGNDANDCQSPATACASIEGTLAKPEFLPRDTAMVAVGTYTGTDDQVVLLNRDVTLSGGWNGTFTERIGASTIDAQDSRRGITVEYGVTASVERFTVQYGRRDGWQDTGGGVYNRGSLTLSRCSIQRNTAYFGGGVRNEGILVLKSSTVSGNLAQTGGGISNLGILTLDSDTVSGNTAVGYRGGGMANQEDGSVTLHNTILADNLCPLGGPDCWGTVESLGYNLVGNLSGCTFSPGPHDLIHMDPELDPLESAAGYHPLLPTSPAVDAGSCPGEATDQRGLPRPIDLLSIANIDNGCDIGAYEMRALGLSTKTVNRSWAPPSYPVSYTIVIVDGSGAGITGVAMTDTLPATLDYVEGSLTATSGEYGYGGGVITWTGSLEPAQSVTVSFEAAVSETVSIGASIVNSAVISGGGDTISRSARLDVDFQHVYLPYIARYYCPPDFYDDFSNPASGWDVVDDSYVRTEYLDGEYRVLTKQSGYFYLFKAPTCNRQNYTVEADARWAGTPGSSYGLIFGLASDYSRYYLFDMNTDYQQFRLLRRDPSGFVTVVPVTSASAINGGTASNHLKVTRNGNGITLEVNGTVLGTWYDGTIGGLTGAGLVTNPYGNLPISDARFDNFAMVTLLDGGASVPESGSGMPDEIEFVAPNARRDPVPADMAW